MSISVLKEALRNKEEKSLQKLAQIQVQISVNKSNISKIVKSSQKTQYDTCQDVLAHVKSPSARANVIEEYTDSMCLEVEQLMRIQLIFLKLYGEITGKQRDVLKLINDLEALFNNLDEKRKALGENHHGDSYE